MIEKTVFIAQDGTHFDNEEDCLQYEMFENIKEIENQIFFYDSNFSKLPLTATEEAIYVHILTKEASLWFKNQNESLGCESPWEQKEDFPLTGIFFWDVYSWKWTELESEYKELKTTLEKIKGVK